MDTVLLRVPGGRLHCEIRGSGPALLLIPGGNGDAGFYAPLAEALAERYTVLAYDRRGFSRSPLDGPVDDRHRLRDDADDAARLVAELAGGPAHVFGSSSGAIVAFELLTRHPEWTRTVVAHEPPAVRLLADGAEYERLFDEIYGIYRREGVAPAMRRFVAAAGAGPPRFGSVEFWRMITMMSRLRRNMRFWLEHELRQYTRYSPDVAALAAASDRLVLAGGRESREHFPYRPNTVLAERIGGAVVDFPGGHAGYRSSPAEFAARLDEVLGTPGGGLRTSPT